MTQGVLSFQYEEEKLGSGTTLLSGLPVYLDFAHVAGLRAAIRRHVRVREGSQGWTDEASKVLWAIALFLGTLLGQDFRGLFN